MGNFVMNGAILAWVTRFQHSVFGLFHTIKIIAVIFKFIYFVDDFKSLKLFLM